MATKLPSLCSKCNCRYRQDKWNEFIPGLGDTAAIMFDPIQHFICPDDKGDIPMTDLLKPDMKSLIWLAVGAFVVPRVLTMFVK